MASRQECEQALQALLTRIAALDPELRRRHAVTRTLSCRVPDLDLMFLATFDGNTLQGLRCCPGSDAEGAQVRLTASSDDLVALVEGTLAPPVAWTSGRLRVEAGVLDLLKLRTLL